MFPLILAISDKTMDKRTKIEICDWTLLVFTILILASGIQLEATHSARIGWIWCHIIVGAIFTAAVLWHLYLHFRWKSWIRRLRSQRSPVTRWLALVGALTMLTALAATLRWLVTYAHTPLGGVHGKLGFVFMALVIGHTAKRTAFFRK